MSDTSNLPHPDFETIQARWWIYKLSQDYIKSQETRYNLLPSLRAWKVQSKEDGDISFCLTSKERYLGVTKSLEELAFMIDKFILVHATQHEDGDKKGDN